jgi:hypothetical protein
MAGEVADPGSPEELPAARRQIGQLIKLTAVEARALAHGMAQFDDEDDFADEWPREDPASRLRIGGVEREYERIINNLFELIDKAQKEAAAQGLADPPPTEREPGRPNRWYRLSEAGVISKKRAQTMSRLDDPRVLFQHGYAFLGHDRGQEVWASMHELTQELPALMGDLKAWVDELWPAAASAP